MEEGGCGRWSQRMQKTSVSDEVSGDIGVVPYDVQSGDHSYRLSGRLLQSCMQTNCRHMSERVQTEVWETNRSTRCGTHHRALKGSLLPILPHLGEQDVAVIRGSVGYYYCLLSSLTLVSRMLQDLKSRWMMF